ncbi:unnamed protein product [Allacma fusca]|uniref:ALMS motif domain-containing protein n=1 Tax=Allacma fusca TaxID=39272 RepID=A0A8J2KBT5_9HEXA|nr:unnamed protein product [Allacma fusca]
MSRKKNRSSRIPNGDDHARDSSPSALSYSSTAALEWDPSADVGSQVPTNTPIHQPKRRDIHSADLSALDQIVMALNEGYDLRPYVTESRSRRFGNDSHKSNGHSDGSNSSYRTATETEQDPIEPTNSSAGLTSVSSDWQTSGLTRSEIAYRSKKDASTARHSHDSSSMLWVEVNPVDESSTNRETTSEEVVDTSLCEKKSVGIQASMKTPGKESCTSTKEPPRKHSKAQSTQVKESLKARTNSQSHDHRVACCTISIPSTSVNHCQQYYVPMQCHCHTMSVQGSGSGRSLGSNPNLRYQQVLSGSSRSNSNDSDITPTCATLERLINEDIATLQNYGYDALEQHRSTLVRKIRKEFQHLERLNKMLMDKKRLAHPSVSSLEPSSSSESKNENSKTVHSSPLPKSSSSDSKTTSKTDNMYVKTTHHPQSQPKTLKTTKSENKKNKAANNFDLQHKPSVCYFVPFQCTPNYMQQPPIAPKTNRHQQFSDKPGQSASAQRNEGDWYNYESSKENRHPGTGSGGIPAPPDQQYYQSRDEYVIFENDMVQISLQQAFQQYCPSALANMQARKQIVNNLKLEREAQGEVKRSYFRQRENCFSPNDSLNQALPNNEPRLMSSRKMRELTEKRVKKLPEIREKEIVRKVEEDKKLNRILSQVFSRKLRQHNLKGEVNIPHSKCLIRH